MVPENKAADIFRLLESSTLKLSDKFRVLSQVAVWSETDIDDAIYQLLLLQPDQSKVCPIFIIWDWTVLCLCVSGGPVSLPQEVISVELSEAERMLVEAWESDGLPAVWWVHSGQHIRIMHSDHSSYFAITFCFDCGRELWSSGQIAMAEVIWSIGLGCLENKDELNPARAGL